MDGHTLLAELDWASSRPGSKWKQRDDENDDHPLEPTVDDEDAWEQCLTQWEHSAYEQYKVQCPNGGLFSLNQNPECRATLSKKGHVSWIIVHDIFVIMFCHHDFMYLNSYVWTLFGPLHFTRHSAN